jgi:hypothetical protein
MIGDGHAAFGGNSACIDDAVVKYVETLAVPPVGTECRQATRLTASAAAPRRSIAGLSVR